MLLKRKCASISSRFRLYAHQDGWKTVCLRIIQLMFSDLYACLSEPLGACLNAWLSLKQSSRHVCFGSIVLPNFSKTLADLGWYSEMLIAPARFRKTFQQPPVHLCYQSTNFRNGTQRMGRCSRATHIERDCFCTAILTKRVKWVNSIKGDFELGSWEWLDMPQTKKWKGILATTSNVNLFMSRILVWGI